MRLRSIAIGIAALIATGAPALAQNAAYDWTGFYAGASIGGTFGQNTARDNNGYNLTTGDTVTYRSSGLTFSGQAGMNWQTNDFVYGVEGDLGFLASSGSGQMPQSCALFGCDTVASFSSNFYADIRGRAGMAWNRALIYGTAGILVVNATTSVIDTTTTAPGAATINATHSGLRAGLIAGVGVEYAWDEAWSVKAEALAYRLSDVTVSGVASTGPTFPWDTTHMGVIARVGANYHY